MSFFRKLCDWVEAPIGKPSIRAQQRAAAPRAPIAPPPREPRTIIVAFAFAEPVPPIAHAPQLPAELLGKPPRAAGTIDELALPDGETDPWTTPAELSPSRRWW